MELTPDRPIATAPAAPALGDGWVLISSTKNEDGEVVSVLGAREDERSGIGVMALWLRSADKSWVCWVTDTEAGERLVGPENAIEVNGVPYVPPLIGWKLLD